MKRFIETNRLIGPLDVTDMPSMSFEMKSSPHCPPFTLSTTLYDQREIKWFPTIAALSKLLLGQHV